MQIAIILTFLAFWELSVRLDWLNSNFVASPTSALAELSKLLVTGQIAGDLRFTFSEIAIAYGLAVSVGVGLGLIIGTRKYLFDVFDPIVITMFAIPKIILFPIFMLWFGVGFNSKMAYGAFAGVFPILINTIAGVRDVKPQFVLLAKSIGASSTQLYGKVLIPALVPMLFAGLRLGLIITGVSVVVAEMVVSTAGLGRTIIELTNKLQAGPVYAIVILLSAIMITINHSLLIIERRQSKFREL